MILTYLIVMLTGVGVSFISTVFGLGGGIIMVPILSLLLSLSHLESIATSLATIIFVASFNTYNFHRKKIVVWKIVPWIAASSAIFAFTSARVSTILSEQILIMIFLLFLLWIAIRTFFIKETKDSELNPDPNKMILLGIGGLSGSISGVTGIGGGGITTPMTLITRMVNNVQAAPTSNAIMIFTSLFASISFATVDIPRTSPFMLGYIHLDIAALLFLGNLIFTRFGVRINQRIPLFWRKTVLGIILVFICIRLFLMLIK